MTTDHVVLSPAMAKALRLLDGGMDLSISNETSIDRACIYHQTAERLLEHGLARTTNRDAWLRPVITITDAGREAIRG